ncbi:MAG: hypothetical protein RSB29_01245 [Alistipes sp.]
MLIITACNKDNVVSRQPAPQNNEEGKDSLSDGNDIYKISATHYILEYNRLSDFSADVNTKTNVITINFGYKSPILSYSWWDEQNSKSASDSGEIYTALCKKYNDLTYNKEYKIIDIYVGDRTFLADNIVSIQVISATDYDAKHPAGSSLNDLCILTSASPRNYILNGYTGSYDWEKNLDGFDSNFKKLFKGDQAEGNLPFSKPLTACTPEEMILMGNGYQTLCMLYLTHKPDEQNKLQRFMITLTDEQGKIYPISTNVCEW